MASSLTILLTLGVAGECTICAFVQRLCMGCGVLEFGLVDFHAVVSGCSKFLV